MLPTLRTTGLNEPCSVYFHRCMILRLSISFGANSCHQKLHWCLHRFIRERRVAQIPILNKNQHWFTHFTVTTVNTPHLFTIVLIVPEEGSSWYLQFSWCGSCWRGCVPPGTSQTWSRTFDLETFFLNGVVNKWSHDLRGEGSMILWRQY